MPEIRFTVHEHSQDNPWIVLGAARHLTVDLEHASDFAAWAAEHWPRERFTAELDPGQEPQNLCY